MLNQTKTQLTTTLLYVLVLFVSIRFFPPSSSTAVTSAETLDACRSLVMELAQLGMARVRRLHARDVDADAGAGVGDLLDRAERGLRQTILLAERLATPRQEQAGPDRVGARKQIIRGVEDRIARAARVDHHGEATATRLRAEFLERLDSPEIEDDVAGRPVCEIIDEICRDLGIEAPAEIRVFKRRTPDDVAALNRLAAMPPGSDLAQAEHGAPIRPRVHGAPAVATHRALPDDPIDAVVCVLAGAAARL